MCVCVCVCVCSSFQGPIKQIISDRAFESIRGLKKNFLKNQACLSLRTQTEIRANEPGSPITLIIRTQHQRTDLNLLELSAVAAAAAGPGVDLRLRGRPGPRRAGLRDFSSFLRREEDDEEEGERERERERSKMPSGQQEKSGGNLYWLQVKLH